MAVKLKINLELEVDSLPNVLELVDNIVSRAAQFDADTEARVEWWTVKPKPEIQVEVDDDCPF